MGSNLRSGWADGLSMDDGRLNILQVGHYDIAGGAERIAMNLLREYRAAGHRAKMAVGEKRGDDPDVFSLDSDALRSPWVRRWMKIEAGLPPVGSFRGAGRLRGLARLIGEPARQRRIAAGQEDFDFPATRQLADRFFEGADAARKGGLIIHCHNLHIGYFDLRQLPALSREHCLVLTLHDMWLLSGHCAHSLQCPRWQSGCGECPNLGVYPPVARDATAFNWRRKKGLYAECRLHVATPSAWLMEKVERSMLWEGVVEAKVIPNGVDRGVFKPASREAARQVLGLPQDARILLFAAADTRSNPFKDYRTLRAAIEQVAERLGEQVMFVALGEAHADERVHGSRVHFVPFERNAMKVAQYYQACDLYVHAALADTFPNSILEAMSCGRPVVATNVGGIGEQVEQGVSGLLTAAGDAAQLAQGVLHLLGNDSLRQRMGEQAAAIAHERFDLSRQAREYLRWYGRIRGGGRGD